MVELLSMKGKNKLCFAKSETEENTLISEKQFDWDDALIDASIIFFISFFTVLATQGLFNGATTEHLINSIVASSIEFFTILAIKRGIREK